MKNQGSVFLYILAAIFLMGVLILTLTNGPQKSAVTGDLDALVSGLYADLNVMSATINECAQTYPNAVDVDGDGLICSDVTNPPLSATAACLGKVSDNPNPPFPLYKSGTGTPAPGGGIVDFSTVTPATATEPKNLVCPGASPASTAGMPLVFTNKNGAGPRLLPDAATYAVNYLNDAVEGVQIRITLPAASPLATPSGQLLWAEAISRLNAKYSACAAAAVAPTNPTAGTCQYGCFYLWLLRRGTSTLGGEAGCP